MRLSGRHRHAILSMAREICGPQARVRLVGSRVDDTQRGGDVDLLVELPYDPDDVYAPQQQLYVRLQRALDGRPVDMLVVGLHTPRQPAHEEAMREGAEL